MRSAALPVPSQTTTGTGGVSVTYSSTARMVLVPPSMTRLIVARNSIITNSVIQGEPSGFGPGSIGLTFLAILVSA